LRLSRIELTFLLGCTADEAVIAGLRRRGAVVIERFADRPYEVFRCSLYTFEELNEVRDQKTRDERIYEYFLSEGKFSPNVIEAITRRLHDDAIDDALGTLLHRWPRECRVGFMGGSSVKRTDLWYQHVAACAQLLARNGYLVITGGGPGMMEAANLGARLAAYSEKDLSDAINHIGGAPGPADPCYVERALDIVARYPKATATIGIPTWFYGHEPTNAFATDIAKYFENSIREAGLIALSQGGVVFCPGSAGTRQEIFMDAAENHYGTTGFVSPMVFFGRAQYSVDTHVYQLVTDLANAQYKNMITLTDEASDVLAFLKAHPAFKVAEVEPQPRPPCPR